MGHSGNKFRKAFLAIVPRQLLNCRDGLQFDEFTPGDYLNPCSNPDSVTQLETQSPENVFRIAV